jgi:hypothetical protein
MDSVVEKAAASGLEIRSTTMYGYDSQGDRDLLEHLTASVKSTITCDTDAQGR